jgi:hypothetical protein
LLIRTQATDVGLIGVERLGEVAEDPERVQDPEDDLHADCTVAMLKASDRVPGHACPISELSLGKPAELAPRFRVCAKVPEGAAHG